MKWPYNVYLKISLPHKKIKTMKECGWGQSKMYYHFYRPQTNDLAPGSNQLPVFVTYLAGRASIPGWGRGNNQSAVPPKKNTPRLVAAKPSLSI